MPTTVSGGSRKLVALFKILCKGTVPPPILQTTGMAAAFPTRNSRIASPLNSQVALVPENLFRRFDFSTEVSLHSPILSWRMSISKSHASAVAHLETTVGEGKKNTFVEPKSRPA